MMDAKEDLVSIITPTYNASRFICETIQSVKFQTYTNWEMIIVDDCSTDQTKELVTKEMMLDARIKVIPSAANHGPAHARNTAIKASKGKYLAFLDSDDLWHPKKLSNQITFMRKNKIGFSYTDYRMMNEAGEKSDRVIRVPEKMEYKELLKNTIIGTLTVVLDKEVVGEVQMPLFRDCSEDYGLWMSILSKDIHAYGLNEELAYYRKCGHSLSSNKFNSAKKTWNTYRKVGKVNIPSALWYFVNYTYHAFYKHTKTS
ncbi:glycosyltransferase family 2 protein [Halobacillus salinarum]|uniref:Glycosyltransferase family 2 protein n=1 Tax=Halobacillus salinarum TaxID=2932257 RepID=A0ABY4EM06_9BACI|nr:glycosyltransferase family A protein [Halobacillus salinarum]UOQ45420.1 glycosyltransferase family 2 protein [Halobacillus salinarum]